LGDRLAEPLARPIAGFSKIIKTRVVLSTFSLKICE
jgi:hypothetical protein